MMCWLLDIPVILGHHSRVDLYAVSSCNAQRGVLHHQGHLTPPFISGVLMLCHGQFLDGLLETYPSQVRQPWFKNCTNMRIWTSAAMATASTRSSTMRRRASSFPAADPISPWVGRMSPEGSSASICRTWSKP